MGADVRFAKRLVLWGGAMPIEICAPLRAFTQAEFGAVAYEVIARAFEVHCKYGKAFDELSYQKALVEAMGERAKEEVCIKVRFGDFEKRYFIDLVVDSGCPFELKVADALHPKHRQQLLQYLMLAELKHGKLINFGNDRVQHEFVNCSVSTERRRKFRVDVDLPRACERDACDRFRTIMLEILRDWGTGLDRGLYIDAMTHFLGGPSIVRQSVGTLWGDRVVGQQIVNLLAPGVAFEVTCFQRDIETGERNLRRLLANTTLQGILWVNIQIGRVKFVNLDAK